MGFKHGKRIRIFALICALVLGISMFGVCPVTAKKQNSKVVTLDTVKVGTKVTVGNIIYKVTKLSKKNSTVTAFGIKKGVKLNSVKKIAIPATVKIKVKKGKNKGTYSYKVTEVSKKAFAGLKKLTEVSIGSNVITIGKNAFSDCVKLKKVSLGKNVLTIADSAFAGDKALKDFVIPKNAALTEIKKDAFKGCMKLTDFNFENTPNLRKINDSAFSETSIDTIELTKIKKKLEEKKLWEKYSYEVIPMISPFNNYFYIKTDNPDPDSFRLVDKKSVYVEKDSKGSITPVDTVFEDVKYEKKETRRVKGGYIAVGSNTDGGELYLELGTVTGTHNVYNITTGETTKVKDYVYNETDVKVNVEKVYGVVDYLIKMYGDSSKSYFDNLSGIQKGFSSECLYSGAYVLGEMYKSTTAPYYGLSTSPHVDQTFYIQSPYGRKNSKSLLVSAIHPMRYDSIGFPSIMSSVAKKLDSTVTVSWSSSAHYLVNVTKDGVTKSYGGAGTGGGQGINADQIKYFYSFDGSKNDAFTKRKLSEVADMLCEYGKLTVPEEPTDTPKLTWASVRNTVGKGGSYVKLVLLTSIFGGSTDGYTFMYDDGSTGEGRDGWGSVGYFHNAWYDGRYINKWEYWYPGAKLTETVETEKPSLVFKDYTLKLPDDGKTYYYNGKEISKSTAYDATTGVWSGFTRFTYDSTANAWTPSFLSGLTYKEDGKSKKIDDQTFIDAATITLEEAKTMNLDANTDKEPANYYIYDRVTEPGTYHKGE